jgi:chromosome segregation ATPase
METLENKIEEIRDILKDFAIGLLRLEHTTERLGQEIERIGHEINKLKDSINEVNKQREEDRKYWNEQWEKAKKEREEDRKRFNKEWGALSNKLGTIVEDIIFPATRPVLESYFKCKITDLSLNREKIKDDLQDEFDVIAVSDECKTVFLIEVKSTPKIDYIDDFRNNKIERFRKLFDEYKDYKLVPIFASLRLQDNIINYLTKHKIYAMAFREWEYMDLLNFDSIKS